MAHTRFTRAKALQKLRDRRAAWLAENGPCKGCGSSSRLEVHHRDKTQKVSHRVWSWAPARMLGELAKCEVLCKPCHVANHKPRLPFEHSIRGYRHGCRCDLCRAAKVASRHAA